LPSRPVFAAHAGVTERSVLITGCSSGIGYDAAKGLRADGWRVFASCRKKSDCTRLIEEGFDSPLIDYAQPQTIRTGLAETLDATGGRLDALFNNGAHALPGAVEDLPVDGLRAIFESNVFGWHDLTRQVIPVMRRQNHGRIVQCSSVLGFVPMPWRGAYVATKHALEGLTGTLRLEMRDAPIDVILIEPGPVTSRIRENSIAHFERWIDWEKSPRVAQYRDELLQRLYEDRGRDRFELPAAAVTAKLRRALTDRRPRARYFVTTPTYWAEILRRTAGTRTFDWILSRG
jgi:NAD(P)-dependent dehydrogenase (short-subunit alcohol dehydrogenase family)